MDKIKQNSPFFGEKNSLKEFFGFIRLKICIFVVCVAISGYLFFNSISEKLFLIALTVFFSSAAGYSLNQITDKKEDLLNNKKINFFAFDPIGKKLVVLLFFLSIFFSLLTSPFTTLIIFLSVFLIATYSIFRIKEKFPFKNLYTAFALSICFLVGASAYGFLSLNMILNYFLVSIFIFAASLIADLRDHKGDKSAGVGTIPVRSGYEAGKKIVYVSLLLFSIFVLGFGSKSLYFILLFVPPIFFFTNKNNPAKAHSLLLLSFMFLPFVLLVIKSGWWLFAS